MPPAACGIHFFPHVLNLRDIPAVYDTSDVHAESIPESVIIRALSYLTQISTITALYRTQNGVQLILAQCSN